MPPAFALWVALISPIRAGPPLPPAVKLPPKRSPRIGLQNGSVQAPSVASMILSHKFPPETEANIEFQTRPDDQAAKAGPSAHASNTSHQAS